MRLAFQLCSCLSCCPTRQSFYSVLWHKGTVWLTDFLLHEIYKTPFPAQESKDIESTVSQCSVRTGLFIPWALDVFVWDAWALCALVSCHYVSRYSHSVSAFDSLVLPDEWWSCSHPTFAMQAIAAQLARRVFWPSEYRTFIFSKAGKSSKMYNKIFFLPYKAVLGVLSHCNTEI